ncbi:hypothetical protein EDB80DRAFT_273651 [Ilyonectria destructans]|nr:hypothetical protein EDB80DRAFT_273651 [Ilyonectria destructans]
MLAKFRWSRASVIVPAAFILTTAFYTLVLSPSPTTQDTPWATDTAVIGLDASTDPAPATQQNYHILMAATHPALFLCKTLLTMAILGYPTPQLIGWGEAETEGLKGGGSHFHKITKSLQYLNDPERRKNPKFDNELLFILDSYDIWFQLPFETLVERYHATVAEENKRVAQRMGRAKQIENVTSSIIFSGGKLCGPNQLHTAACYPVPESPLPKDLYGGNTNTGLGANAASNFRTRYLVSGALVGPVGEMRALLQRASDELDKCVESQVGWFNLDGPLSVQHCYKGSDQSIFVEMFGRQEFHREVMRRVHRRRIDNIFDAIIPGRAGSWPHPNKLWGVTIDDPLNPPFPHEEVDPGYLPGKPYEFGIAIDYWSLLIHDTSNAKNDARYIRLDESFTEQVGARTIFDCKAKPPRLDNLPRGGILDLMPGRDWSNMPMYSEICLGVVPTMIHHNSVDKYQIEFQWNQTWWYGHARRLLELRRQEQLPMLVEGFPTGRGTFTKWDDLCPADFDEELYRGYGVDGKRPGPEVPDFPQDPLDQVAPVEEAPVQGVPNEDAPVQDTPEQVAPVEVAPVQDVSKEDAPVQDALVLDVPKGDAVKDDAPKDPLVLDTPKDDAVKDDAPKDDAPKDDAVKDDAPKDDAPKDDAVKDDAPKDDAVKDDAPKDDTPKDDVPKDTSVLDTPKEDAAKEDPPKEDAPKEDAAKEDAAKEDAPKEDAAKEDPPKEDAPKEDAPKEDIPKEDASKDDIPNDDSKEDIPKDNTPQEDTPKDDVSKEDPPKDDTPKDDTPKDDTPKDDTAKDDTPKDDTPKDDAPADDASKEDASKEDTPKDDTPKDDTAKDDTPEDNDANKDQTPPEDPPKDETRVDGQQEKNDSKELLTEEESLEANSPEVEPPVEESLINEPQKDEPPKDKDPDDTPLVDLPPPVVEGVEGEAPPEEDSPFGTPFRPTRYTN